MKNLFKRIALVVCMLLTFSLVVACSNTDGNNAFNGNQTKQSSINDYSQINLFSSSKTENTTSSANNETFSSNSTTPTSKINSTISSTDTGNSVSATTNSASSIQNSTSTTPSTQNQTIIPTSDAVFYQVDSSFSGTNGTVVNNMKTFNTVTSAIENLSSSSLSATLKKVIYINGGTYTEKITIPATLKNVYFWGDEDMTTTLVYGDYASKNDMGTEYTASVNIYGEGFYAYKINFKNSFDYINSSATGKQALAVRCDADKSIFNECTFYGQQDTLMANLGRQYYYNCLIQGSVDFIFGTNSTSLFSGCEIRSLYRGSDGGYIAVHKGNNGTNGVNVPKYGYVFDDCSFTRENSNVKNSTISLARPWRADATCAFINSTMDSHISKKAYTNQNGGARYVYMNGGYASTSSTVKLKNEPQNAHFYEYNNSGSGAISSSVTGCKMLSETEIATYTIANIFAKTNGTVSYSTTWSADISLNTVPKNF